MGDLKEKRLFLLDMDGTIYIDNELFDGTLDLLDYVKKVGKNPPLITFSLAALLAFYSSEDLREDGLHAHRGNTEYVVRDDAAVLRFFAENSGKCPKDFVNAALSNTDFFGEDLTKYEGLADAVTAHLANIKRDAKASVRSVL